MLVVTSLLPLSVLALVPVKLCLLLAPDLGLGGGDLLVRLLGHSRAKCVLSPHSQHAPLRVLGEGDRLRSTDLVLEIDADFRA